MLKKSLYMFANLVVTFTIFAIPVSAQRLNYDYYYSGDVGFATFFGAFAGLFWLLLLCAFIFLMFGYIFSCIQLMKIYKKNGLEDSAAFAFIPVANVYFLAVAVGEKTNAPLYAFGPFGLIIFACCSAIIPFVGLFVICGVWLAILVIQSMLMMKVASWMGKSEGLGLAQVLSLLIPVVGYFISLYILFDIANGEPVKAGGRSKTGSASRSADIDSTTAKDDDMKELKNMEDATDDDSETKKAKKEHRSENVEKKEGKARKTIKKNTQLASDSARIK